MPGIKLFFDSSALVAGIVSPTGASRALMQLSEVRKISLIISEQVVAETERAIARKVPGALPEVRQAILSSNAQIVKDPSLEEVRSHLHAMKDTTDVPILLAAIRAKSDYLVTLNRKHFIDDPGVAKISSLKIGTPGDGPAWVRTRLAGESE
jgi:predicted nucleic acid-binding protein